MGKYFHLVATGLTLLLQNTVAGTIIRHNFVCEVHISNPGQDTGYSDWDISVVCRFRGGALNYGHSAVSRAFSGAVLCTWLLHWHRCCTNRTSTDIITEHGTQMFSIPAFYSEGSGFKSRLGDRQTRFRFFFFLSSVAAGKISTLSLKLSHN